MVDIPRNCNIYSRMRQADIYQRVGKNLAARRNALGRTQSSIAKEAGISRPSLANIENGNQTITLHQLYKLAAALKLSDARTLLPVGTTTLEDQKIQTEDVNIRTTADLKPGHKKEIQDVIAAWGGKT